MRRFENKVAIVTGAASGIDNEFAHCFAKEGGDCRSEERSGRRGGAK
jgi:NADP-dependent 3-hydroxy acid dehydrogenase YdfG